MSGEAYPSASLVAALEQAVLDPDPVRRAARAWHLVYQASANSDGGVVRDLALDHGLIAPLDEPSQARQHGPVQRLSWRHPCDGSEMIWIPAGPAIVGRPMRRRPPTRVTLPGFSLARHPVTQAQFKRFLDETAYRPPAWHPRNDLFLANWHEGRPRAGEADHPVTWVSFFDALAYCAWAGLTLPTEWLWEKAARGPEGWTYPWGQEAPSASPQPLLHVRADHTAAVGSYPRTRSVYGCEDLLGNVAEWCQPAPGDRQDHVPSPVAVVEEPHQGVQLACVRGSCFLRKAESGMTGWHRRKLSATRRNQWVGFRPASLLPYRAVGAV